MKTTVFNRPLDKLVSRYRSLPVQMRASAWALCCGVLQRGIQVIVTPLFTRLMNTSEYGDFTAFQSWLDVLGIFLTLRLYYGVFAQGLVRYAEGREDAFTSHIIGLMAAVEMVALVVYVPFADFWDSITGLSRFQMLGIFVISFTSGLFDFWKMRQRVRYKYRMLVALTLVFAVAQPLIGVVAVLAFPESKVDARVVSMVVVQMFSFGWLAILYVKRGGIPFDHQDWLRSLKMALPLIPHYLSGALLATSDRIMIRSMDSSAAAGIYGLAYSLSFLMAIVNQAVVSTLEPWVYQRIRDGKAEDIPKVGYAALCGVAFANLATIALAPEALAVFAPAEYSEGMYLVPPLAASVVLTFLYMLFAEFEFYYERTDLVAIASATGAVVNVGLNLLLIPRFGYQSAAWTTLVGYVVYVGMHYAFMIVVQKNTLDEVKVYNAMTILKILFAFAASAAILRFSYPYPLVRYGIIIAGVVLILVNRNKFSNLIRSVSQKA